MRTVNEVKKAKEKIKRFGLLDKYQKQKALFINNPAHPSLDFIMIDKKHRICSFKINKQYRVKIIKNVDDSYSVIDADDYHKKS